jgi:ribosomal protein S18 acetylase RimI-like enzyme
MRNAQGAAVLRLGVAEDNEQAATLYRRNGFTGTGELTGPLPDGIRMEKVISPAPLFHAGS